MIQTLPGIRLEPQNFCYWLQGLLEDARLKTLDEVQVQMIREHLALVFTHAIPVPAPVLSATPESIPAPSMTMTRFDELLGPKTVMIC